jgi:hypothetical protein
MSALTFKAVIGGVHFDPKKGIVKIQLEATSYVSLDELTSLGPHDESIRVRFESEQTKIEVFPLEPITIDEEGAKRLKEAARKLQNVAEEPRDEEKGLDEEDAERLKKKAEELRDSPFGVDDEPLGDLPRG